MRRRLLDARHEVSMKDLLDWNSTRDAPDNFVDPTDPALMRRQVRAPRENPLIAQNPFRSEIAIVAKSSTKVSASAASS